MYSRIVEMKNAMVVLNMDFLLTDKDLSILMKDRVIKIVIGIMIIGKLATIITAIFSLTSWHSFQCCSDIFNGDFRLLKLWRKKFDESKNYVLFSTFLPRPTS